VFGERAVMEGIKRAIDIIAMDKSFVYCISSTNFLLFFLPIGEQLIMQKEF